VSTTDSAGVYTQHNSETLIHGQLYTLILHARLCLTQPQEMD
jgi:hypothetical protein